MNEIDNLSLRIDDHDEYCETNLCVYVNDFEDCVGVQAGGGGYDAVCVEFRLNSLNVLIDGLIKIRDSGLVK
jgi:hypothetical protein